MSGTHGPHAQKGNRTVLEARELEFAYRAGEPVLQGASVQIEPGALVGILGVNGCGKSTLLACLNGVLAPTAGEVLLDGQPLAALSRTERARKIAFVEQQAVASNLSVYDALLLGRRPHLQGAPREEDHAIVEEIITELGMERMALRSAAELSGGELQKVMLARAFVQQTDVLLLDEPTNNLDPANQHEVMQAVRHMVTEHGLAAAAVLHDVNLALHYCDRFVLMRQGRVDAAGGPEVMTAEVIARTYGIDCQVIDVESPHGHSHTHQRVVVF